MIEIIHTRENETDRTVFFKITIKDEIYPFHADCPLDQDPQAYLESMKDKITVLIFNRLYPENDHKRFMIDDVSEISAMKLWIKDGCKNQIIVGYYKNEKPKYGYEVIEKVPWKSTHPPNLALKAEIDKATTLTELKDVMKKVIIA